MLLAIALLCAARLYYFCFYVIERYIDPSYRFAGLWSAVAYLLRRGSATEAHTPSGKPAEPH